tara:strand:- start:46 stop:609 length:564 start_codon:yes stop_codon:yes gene_type:complete
MKDNERTIVINNRKMSSLDQQFLALYEQYADPLYRFIYYKVRQDHELAQDILAQTFCNAWNSFKKKGGFEHEQAFLYKIARNLVIDYIKKASTQREFLMEEDFDAPDDRDGEIVNFLDHQLALEVCKNLLASLPDTYIEVIQLRFIEDRTIDEISELLSISKNNVSLRIHRALKSMKKLYEQELQTT